ncbi:MAG: hypothetical protein GC161_14925 [Planctomycetaceae bacterium]|nr:hypothetical protein [Planctomycetaceae bacterium]
MSSGRGHWIAAWVAAVVLAVVGAVEIDRTRTWGWDESMHAQLPAARIAFAVEDGRALEALRVLHDCQQYPFVWPAVLGLVQSATGLSEPVARATGRVAWAAALLAIFALTWRTAARAGLPSRALAAWIAIGLALLSPLATAYSATLFLEVPFVLAMALALLAWLARSGRRRAELIAGAAMALCFFTKFNYGLLFGFGLFLHLVWEAVDETRAGRGRKFAARCVWLATPVLAAWLWWFVWPWPAGSGTAASHREAMLHFLGGNRDESLRTAAGLRWVDWGCFLVRSPRWLLVLLAGALAALVVGGRVREVRLLTLVFVAMAVPVSLHPFHLDRFLLPVALPLWVLVGVGWARLSPRSPKARLAAGALAALVLFPAPEADGTAWLRWMGFVQPDPALREIQRDALAQRRDLLPGRSLLTNGLRSVEADAIAELVARDLRVGDRLAWVGMSQTFPPAALLLRIVERGGPAAAAARAQLVGGDLQRAFLTIGYTDPNWDAAQVLGWYESFTAIVATEPVDLGLNPRREFMARYRTTLVESGVWEPRLLGSVPIVRPWREAYPADVYVLRRAADAQR